LKQIFGEKFFNEVGNIVKEEHLIPNQMVFTPFDKKFLGIYSIKRGEVDVL
jgi:hypothetical protein